jgi:hypothetical protein
MLLLLLLVQQRPSYHQACHCQPTLAAYTVLLAVVAVAVVAAAALSEAVAVVATAADLCSSRVSANMTRAAVLRPAPQIQREAS